MDRHEKQLKRARKKFAKKRRTPPTEFWGEWEDRSHMVDLFPGLHKPFKAVLNRVYSAQFFTTHTAWGDVIRMSVRRHDASPIRRWSDLQRIKAENGYGDRTGVEVYPADSELVDVANMYHIWILPAGFNLPFTLKHRE